MRSLTLAAALVLQLVLLASARDLNSTSTNISAGPTTSAPTTSAPTTRAPTTSAPTKLQQWEKCRDDDCHTETSSECFDQGYMGMCHLHRLQCLCGCAGFPSTGPIDRDAVLRCIRLTRCLQRFIECWAASCRDGQDDTCQSCEVENRNCLCECVQPDVPDRFPEDMSSS